MGQLTTPRASAEQNQPMLRVVIAVLLLAATTVVFGVFNPSSAHATDPVIKGPDAVFSLPALPIPFAGMEVFANNKSRKISITATDNNATCKPQADPQDLSGCSNVYLDVTVGKLTLTAGNAIVTVGDAVNGTGVLQLSGKVADLNSALASLTWIPPSLTYTNLPDAPARLKVDARDGSTGDSTITDDMSYYIDIRVALVNLPPSEAHPTGPFNVPAGTDKTFTGGSPQDYLVSDPDVDSNSEHGKMLLIAWVDCGSFTMSTSSNMTFGNDLKGLLTDHGGIDPTIVDTVFDALPASVKNLPFVTNVDGATAIAGVGELGDLNNLLSTVTFHAPNTAQNCTLTQVVDDLGNHGLPGQYQNTSHDVDEFPVGVELPAQLFVIPQTTFVVTVPQVTVNQQTTPPAQADPTADSPIHFTAVFTDAMQGFGDAPTDVTLSGTAGATQADVSPVMPLDGKTCDIAVSGMTQSGTVIVDVPAGAAQKVADTAVVNAASTSTDHTVTFVTNPTVTINQAVGQSDPASTSPVDFDVVFSQPVVGFGDSPLDVDLSTSTAGTLAATVTTVNSTHYTVHVTGMSVDQGHVIATVPADAAQDAAFNSLSNVASTSTDNDVKWVVPTAPTAVVSLNAGTTDPSSAASVTFLVTFSEPVHTFDLSDITFDSTAGANSATVTPLSTSQYTVQEMGMSVSGNVNLTVAAGAVTSIATSLPNTVSNTGTLQWVKPAVPIPPTVTINQGVGQADPTSVSPIVFDVVFSELVSGFDQFDIVLSGTAGATTKQVVQGVDAAHYTVSVTGMVTSGTVIADIPAGAATSQASSLPNAAATFTDHMVQYNRPAPPALTIDQSPLPQTDPTFISPLNFDIVSDQPINIIDPTLLTIVSTAGPTIDFTVGIAVIDATHQHLTISGMTQNGTVTVSIPAGVTTAAALPNLPNTASTSTDNMITFQIAVPPTAPTVTINQAVGQADPTSTAPIRFSVVFSAPVSGFGSELGDVVVSGTAGGTKAVSVVASDSTHYEVQVVGMTTPGTVIATIPAGAAQTIALPLTSSQASTSTDNVVTWVGVPPLTIQVPPDKTVPNDPGLPGAVVTYAAPTTTGGVAPVTVTCTSASGAFYNLGPTLVTCTATDSGLQPLIQALGTQRNVAFSPFAQQVASGSFTITVVDAETPTISHPDVTVHTTNPSGATVDYGPSTAADNSGVPPTVTCTVATNANFVVGTTSVTCTATDAAQNTASATFMVNVILDTVATTPTTTPPVTVATTPPVTIAPGGNLPETGTDSGQSLRVALVLSAVGFLLLIFARRRKLQF